MAYTPPDLSIIVELEPDYTPPDLSIAVELDVGDTSEAYAVIGLGLDAAAVGWRDSEAATTIGLGLDEAATGYELPAAAATLALGLDALAEGFAASAPPAEAYAALGLGLDAAAVGWRDSEAAATVGLGLDEAAAGWAQPLFPAGLWLALGDDPPRNWPASAISGYHRPLSGEAANLTLTLDIPWRDRKAWSSPPLGASATVRYGAETLLEGALTAVSWSRSELTVSVEG